MKKKKRVTADASPAAKALTPTVIKLGIVSFFADVSSEMLYPVTPLFLTMVLGASVSSVGLIEGVAEGVSSLIKTSAGRLSDRLQKRKLFIGLGYLFAAVAKPIIGTASGWAQVLFARSFDRVGKGIRSAPKDALLADSVDARYRGEAFGWHRLMDTMGAAVGPLLAIAYLHFYRNPEELRRLYYLALIPGLVSVFIVLTIRDRVAKTPAAKKSDLNFRALPKDFKRYLLGWGIFSLANSSDVFLILKSQKSGLTLTVTILMYVFYNLLYALSSPYLGRLSDTLGRKTILIFGLLVFSLVYLAFGFASTPWHFWTLFGIYGLYMGATEGVGKAYAVDLVPPDMKATGVGILGTVTGITMILASSIAGLVWDRAGSEWTFILGSIGALAAVGVLATLPRKQSLKPA